MRWSDERILTTHTGSLPRPPELTRLYVRRARGEAIDPAELDQVGIRAPMGAWPAVWWVMDCNQTVRLAVDPLQMH